MRSVHLFCLLLLAVAATAAAAPPAAQRSPEENILHDAGVPADGDGLLAFFRGRTLTDAESKKIADLIHRLGGDDFDDRESAAKELRKVGGRATPLVHEAARSTDVEVVRRAKLFLKEVDAPAQLPVIAAARLLARRTPADAVPVLLAYLPFADDLAVEDEVQAALLALTPDGKPDRTLIAALDDAQPAKRAGAAYVLGRKGDKDQRAAVRKRLDDKEAPVRWQAANALMTAHDRAAVPGLVKLLAEGPFDTAWRAEEVLQRLAGDKAPALTLDDSPEMRCKCRDAWAAWWKEKGEAVDLAAYKEPERLLGYTLGVEYNTGRVWECDIDGSIRWEIRDLEGPMDAQVLPNGRVLIAEAGAHRVTERDLKGAVLWEKRVEADPKKLGDGEPNGCRRLPDGNTFITTCDATYGGSSSHAMEFKPDGTMLYSFKLENSTGGVNAVCKSRNGLIYFTWQSGIQEMDGAGKVPRNIPLPKGLVKYVGLDVLPGQRFLVADSHTGYVLEVNATGAILWQADMKGACGIARLPNGHTLVGANRKVVELSVDGKPVWEKTVEGYVRRVYRR